MKVGDYVRTDKGYITKIIDFKEHYTKGKRLGLKEEVIENFLLLDNKQCEIIDSIDYSIPPLDLWYEEEDVYYERWFGLNDLKKLKDYITNLRQINKNLTNSLNKKVEEGIKLQLQNDKLQEQFKDWKKEIEKEKKYYLCDRTDCCGRIKDSKKYSSLYCELKDYKSRNEKAIEITNKIIDAGYDTNEVLTLAIKQLDVLQGVDKD